MLSGKKILIGITGSIAAYKIPLLVRLFKKENADIKAILTPDARDFITPLTLSTLSGHPVYSRSFDHETGEWHSHVELGLWADIFIIAPLTANTMAKMAAGIADNFLLTTYLSAKCDVFFAPAMDRDMFRHPSTQENLKTIQDNGNILLPPNEGELASGLCGEGRMQEPETILHTIKRHLQHKHTFKGKKVLVTAGPTFESIDPVRFIGNYSSGRMGYEIAAEFAKRGAEVTLISGPSHLDLPHPSIQRVGVISAEEMESQCMACFPDSDITVMAAAVADYTPIEKSSSKLKKKVDNIKLELKKTPDILEKLGKLKKDDQLLAGFALETDDEETNAKEKLNKKNLDLIVLNSLKDDGAGFGHTTNKISIFTRSGKESFDLKSKKEVASDITDFILKVLESRK